MMRTMLTAFARGDDGILGQCISPILGQCISPIQLTWHSMQVSKSAQATDRLRARAEAEDEGDRDLPPVRLYGSYDGLIWRCRPWSCGT